ncbi:MAG: pyridoxamine kinase [Lachnospiraceae bacterium]|nr:pyridoxamine kinase [Lachnospiraceae bacterium]
MKKVALINDLSGFGRCSLTAAIPVISALGVQACPLPTAVLTAQTGFGTYYCDDYTDRIDYFTEQWFKMGESFDGIYSGFLASFTQLEKVNTFLDHFHTENTLFLADPIMGDHGERFPMFSKAFLQSMRELTLRADIITPNLTELCLLTDTDYEKLTSHSQDADYLQRIREICLSFSEKANRPQTIIVTGILRKYDDNTFITNLAVSKKDFIHVETPYTGTSFSGTGDLFASTICGCLVKGLPLSETLQKAADFLQPAIEEATNKAIPRNYGVPFEKYLNRLF